MQHEDQSRNEPKGTLKPIVVGCSALTNMLFLISLITAEVPVIYMHQFWATVIKHKSSYRFKINKKRFSVNVEVFREILNICPKVPGKAFDEPPTEEEALSFIRKLGHTGEIKYITDVSGLDKIRLLRVQILWGMYYKKNLDFVALIWEDLAYQIDNIDSKKQDKIHACTPKVWCNPSSSDNDKSSLADVSAQSQGGYKTKQEHVHISSSKWLGGMEDLNKGFPDEQHLRHWCQNKGTGNIPGVS
ncbi:hypothetical protein Tco_0379510 [Tanacetum coccineum]